MSTATAQSTIQLPGPPTLRYLARQPILDMHEHIIGYELLFRDGSAGFLTAINSDRASMTTIDSSLLLGASSLTGGKRAFVNCTRELLVSGLVTLLPPDLSVLEILEDVAPDEEVLRACRKLRAQGYALAMDDFVARHSGSPFLDLVKYVKVDLRSTSRDEQLEIARTWPSALNSHRRKSRDPRGIRVRIFRWLPFLPGIFLLSSAHARYPRHTHDCSDPSEAHSGIASTRTRSLRIREAHPSRSRFVLPPHALPQLRRVRTPPCPIHSPCPDSPRRA